MYKEEMRMYIDLLHKWDDAYNKGAPEATDAEYDKIYFELMQLERTSGFAFKDSPTQSIRYEYEVVDKLEKVKHNHPLLSLAKTKSVEDLEEFVGDKHYFLMAKCDGLTISLRYLDGKLVSAETRGNGEIGEDVLHNVRTIKNIPMFIPYRKELIIDGEAIIKYSDFEKFKDGYANPRNLVAGSIRLLDAAEAAQRDISFIAWKVYKGFDDIEWYSEKLGKLYNYGFEIVPFRRDDEYCPWADGHHNMQDFIDEIKEECNDIPIDGMVVSIDSIKEAAEMGEATQHHEQYQLAYKFFDEEYETTLKDIDYDVSRNGQMVPVAVFEEVKTLKSIISRASLHNISTLKNILGEKPWVGQKIKVVLSNDVIPQIVWGEREINNRKDT